MGQRALPVSRAGLALDALPRDCFDFAAGTSSLWRAAPTRLDMIR